MKALTLRVGIAWIVVLLAVVCGCSGEDDQTAGGGGAAAAQWPGSGNIGGNQPSGDEFYLVHTEDIRQNAGPDREVDLSSAGYVNPYATANWLSPIRYRDGEVSFYIEVLSTSDRAVPFDYTIAWRQGSDPDDTAELRATLSLEEGVGTLEEPIAVGLLQRVEGEAATGTPVGDNWDWEHAFGKVTGSITTYGDDPGAAFSANVRLKLLVRPPAGQ